MTEFGEQAWDVVSRCTGQILRAGMDGRIMGIDFGACLVVARAAGYEEQAVAEDVT